MHCSNVNMVCEKSSSDKKKKVWFSLTWLPFQRYDAVDEMKRGCLCSVLWCISSITCWLASEEEVNIAVLTENAQSRIFCSSKATLHLYILLSEWTEVIISFLHSIMEEICVENALVKVKIRVLNRTFLNGPEGDAWNVVMLTSTFFRIRRFCVVCSAAFCFCSSWNKHLLLKNSYGGLPIWT